MLKKVWCGRWPGQMVQTLNRDWEDVPWNPSISSSNLLPAPPPTPPPPHTHTSDSMMSKTKYTIPLVIHIQSARRRRSKDWRLGGSKSSNAQTFHHYIHYQTYVPHSYFSPIGALVIFAHHRPAFPMRGFRHEHAERLQNRKYVPLVSLYFLRVKCGTWTCCCESRVVCCTVGQPYFPACTLLPTVQCT